MIRLPRLPVTQTVTASELHIATRDGEAMFFHDTLDFSAYENDFYFEFIDSDDKVATAYSDAAGAGETSVEVATNGNLEAGNTTGWHTLESAGSASLAVNSTTPLSGSYDLKVVAVNSGSYPRVAVEVACTVNSLYKLGQWLYSGPETTAAYLFVALNTTTGASRIASRLSASKELEYITAVSDYTRMGAITFATGTHYLDNFSLKRLTDVPTTGLRLRNLSNDRDMQSVETDFNPNDVTKIRIWRP